MTFKPTVLGVAPAPAPAPATPGSGVNGGFKPTAFPGAVSPATVTPRPTALGVPQPFQPLAPVAPPAMAPVAKPTALPPAPAAAAPVSTTAMPGVQRKPMEVQLSDLVRRFPQASPVVLQRVQALLSGLHIESMNSTAWLNFGVPGQSDLVTLVKQRLKLAEEQALRTIPQHLSRLHDLLADLMSALEGGLLRKHPTRVWAEIQPEVMQLENLLAAAGPAVRKVLQDLEGLKQPAAACGDRLEAFTMAAEYLDGVVPQDASGLLVARVSSLMASQATLKEHLLYLEQAMAQAQELATLVQDGVLVKLPAVYSQLANMAAKLTDTDRNILKSTLYDLQQSLNRKNP